MKDNNEMFLGYADDEQSKYFEYKEYYKGKTVTELKTLLQNNGMSKTGMKCDLVEKCANGKVLGAIPRCEKCGGGRPKWNNKTGEYHCSGYMDENEWIQCDGIWDTLDITRQPWID